MINLVLIANEEKIFDGKIREIETNTVNGPVTILPHHQPYLTKIDGFVSYETENGLSKTHKISRGFMYTNGDICFVIVDAID